MTHRRRWLPRVPLQALLLLLQRQAVAPPKMMMI
jgi:hypothetical protein